MMYQWEAEHIRFMQDAADYGDYHRHLAEKLLPHLPPGGRICDAGCGLGYLAEQLTPYFQEVTACDISPNAIREIQRRIERMDHLHLICGDIRKHPPQTPYDGMVFCLFGSWEEILLTAKEQCRGPVCVVSRGDRRHRFSVGRQNPHTDHASDLAEMLQKERIPFHREDFSLEFGQPFHGKEEAMAFFRLYNCGDREVEEKDIEKRLIETGRTDFPLYLPQEKELTLFCFNGCDIP